MKSKEQKNKEGIANILLMLAIGLIIGGVVIGLTNGKENVGTGFFLCLIGTFLSFVSGYIRHGYIKFFN